MTDRPILFSAPMVRALLEGRKTQTRRVIKPQPTGRIDPLISFNHGRMEIAFGPDMRDKDGGPKWWRPLAQAGDRLWVREACAIVGTVDPGFVLYRADGYEAECERHGFDKPFPPEAEARWRPSIHMPRWASRITLEVIDVRVERLHDISEADAFAEGVTKVREACHVIRGFDYDLSGLCHTSAITPFLKLWNHINGPDAWESNPWVAAYTFHVINRNIDQIGVAA
ncbi:hypothetical protein [Ochrobactrum sp. EDr1-4]|uniref:hypothetical protein n=1 Tax=Ochrobactrum sp. EDr1-4 TaxID=3368622 RepID=UPI003B9F93F5